MMVISLLQLFSEMTASMAQRPRTHTTPCKRPDCCLARPSSPVIPADRSICKGACCRCHQAFLSKDAAEPSLKGQTKATP